MEEIKLNYATVEYKEPIIYIRFKDPIMLGPKEVLEIGEAAAKLTNNGARLVLTDVRVLVDITEEGREVSSTREKQGNVIAHAVLIKWLAQWLIAKVYMEINKPDYPMRAFRDEQKAIKWLLEQKNRIG